MQLTIPLGSRILTSDKKTIEIRIPNTQFWILGEQQTSKLWNAYIIDSKNHIKDIIKENISTKAFSIFSNLILKTPFPYVSKQKTSSKLVIKFIKQLTQ